MQAIPVNLSYGKYTAQRRSSEPHLSKHNISRTPFHRGLTQHPSITPNPQHSLRHSKLVSTPTSIPRVLTRLGIGSNQSTPISKSNHYKHKKKPRPESNHKPPPKPNRTLYRRLRPNAQSIHRSMAHIDYSMTPDHNPSIEHTKSYTKHRKSPCFPSITRESKHRRRSHSFSISRTYSHNRSKAHSRLIPPTHSSPSTTHYTVYSKSPEITPPPPSIPLPPSLHSIGLNLAPHRMRPRSLSHSTSFQTPNKSTKKDKESKPTHIPSGFNAAQILRMSDHENDIKLSETETIEINNGKSLLFSSWFSGPSLYLKPSDVIEGEDDELIKLNESDIESAIRCMNDVHSSLSSTDSNQKNVIEESKSNNTFTLGLKPPRKYRTEKADQQQKEEMISFRDFLAQENRKALQREVVNVENKQSERGDDKPNGFGTFNNNVDRFYILKGNTHKIDYGLPEGPYTLYKFVITFNHPYRRPIKVQKSHDSIYDEKPRKKTSHWSIKKRYSDFFTFNNNLIAEIKGLHLKDKTIKLPKLPPKTFKKTFNATFVSQRHDALLDYLTKIICITELTSSVTLLTFLGAVNNHTLPYNDKFLESRMTLGVYISNYADTGDVLLFETKSYIAASLRSVTASNYDHVGLVYRDIDGSHECHEGKDSINGLYLVESTVDGVRTYPLKNRLKQWSVLCPQIVVRRLKLLKPGVQKRKMEEWASSSLGSLRESSLDKYSKYDYLQKDESFYNGATEFVDAVNGLDYAIWSNVFRLNDVPFEKQKSFFCSQLVTAFFKFMHLLPQDVKTNRILPGHYGDDIANNVKLSFIDCLLTKENLLLFKLPAVGAAKHKLYRH